MLLPSPRVLCSVFLFSTVWVAPLFWASFYGEYSAAHFFVPSQCTVAETNIKRAWAGRLVRYVAVWNVYWYKSSAAPLRTHSASLAPLAAACAQQPLRRVDEAGRLRTGQVYGQTGDGSIVFSWSTRVKATAETSTPAVGDTVSCVYDGRVARWVSITDTHVLCRPLSVHNQSDMTCVSALVQQ